MQVLWLVEVLVIVSSRVLLLFFFFQAEDGIRDLTVTGVQTCALPISARAGDIVKPIARTATTKANRFIASLLPQQPASLRRRRQIAETLQILFLQIGRASCRERV